MSRLSDLIDARVARRRALREELAPLDQDLATDAERAAARHEALVAERLAVAQRLAHAERLPPAQPVEVPLTLPHDWPSAGQLAGRLRTRLAAVDAEIARVE